MAVYLAPGVFGAGSQFFTAGGVPLVGGKLLTTFAGTNSNVATYTTQSGLVQNANPIILGPDARPPSEIWFPSGIGVKITLSDKNNVVLNQWDNLYGIGDPLAPSAGGVGAEWLTESIPTFISATSFSVVGTVTAPYTIGRRVRTQNTGGVVLSTITSAAAAGGVVTVNVSNDVGGTLDSGLSAVWLGILDPTANSIGLAALILASLNNTPIGATTPNTGAFTSGSFTLGVTVGTTLQVTGNSTLSGSTTTLSASNTAATVTTPGTGGFVFATRAAANTVLTLNDAGGTGANAFTMTPATAGNAPQLAVTGSDTNVSFYHVVQGTGTHFFTNRGGLTSIGFAVADSGGAAADYLQIKGAVTANPATITLTAIGTDANVNVNIVPKGTGRFQINGVNAGSGTVTSVTAGSGLTGGTFTTSGTVALDMTQGDVGTLTIGFVGSAPGPGATSAGSGLANGFNGGGLGLGGTYTCLGGGSALWSGTGAGCATSFAGLWQRTS